MENFEKGMKKEVDDYLERNIRFTHEERERIRERIAVSQKKVSRFNPVYWTVLVAAASIFIVLSLSYIKGSNNGSPENITPPGVVNGNGQTDLPDEEELPVEVDREQDINLEVNWKQVKASLHHGKGFSLYVLEKYTFDAATGRLSLKDYPKYYVDIELLPSDYDLAQLEVMGKEELSKKGEVSNYSGELIEHPLGYADLALQTSGMEGLSDYIVWKSESGDAFLFRHHNPGGEGEEVSYFANSIFISLSTVEKETFKDVE